MTDTLHIVFIWLHILGVALYVGPQFFLAFAWAPASRGIADLSVRARAARTITRRFGYIAGTGLLLLLVAGGYLIGSWRDYYHIPDSAGFTDYRYGVLFIVKMSILVVMLAVVGWHVFRVGPHLVGLMEAQGRGEPVSAAALRSARLQSMAYSVVGLALVLVIMALGAMMNTTTYAVIEI
ncbi:MAG: hypothetical protein IT304_07280 [Dehalococcoidia bacterium]|nr:hypothetical protein [Dehalococcoidia bacterium]